MMSRFKISRFHRFMLMTAVVLSSAIAGFPLAGHAQTSQGKLVEANGKVQLKRQGWTRYQPVGVGAELRVGDLLFPAPGTKVVVQCKNFSFWRVPAGIPSGVVNGCPLEQRLVSNLRGNRSPLVTVIGGTDSRIPYVISPRRTWILTQTPTLRWHPVAGVKFYRVRVKGPGVDWATQVTTPSVIYPGTPPLQAGATYLVTVQTDTGQSSQQDDQTTNENGVFYAEGVIRGYGFSLLPSDLVGAIRTEVQKIEQQSLSSTARAIALANLYTSQELYAEAIAQLELLTQNAEQPLSVYQMLGDLYSHTGLGSLAEPQFLQALERAKTSQNLEGQARACESLATLYEVNGNLEGATQFLKQAQSVYEQLGDTKQVNQLQSRLTKLMNRTVF